MEDINSPKVEIKADLTQTIGKAYDDTLKEPLKSSSNVLSTVFDFFHNTVLYPMQKYNLYAKNKLENYALELQKRAQGIPKENLTFPRVNIIGPTFDGLKYNLDEEHIKEIFTNILISDMDNRKQNKVLPAYIEITKQLSKQDAMFLKNFENRDSNTFALVIPEYNVIPGGSISLGKELIFAKEEIITLNDLVIDNLERLNILKIYDDRYITESQLYDICFKKVQHKYINSSPLQVELTYKKAVLMITEFGKNFIDICLS